MTALLAPTLAWLMLRRRGVAMFDVLRHRISTGRILHNVPTHTPKLRQKKNRASGEFQARSERRGAALPEKTLKIKLQRRI